MIDYLIVGAGLTGATFADLCHKKGLSAIVIDKKDVIAGAIRSERKDNIDVHLYGPHIFHTSDKEVWDYFSSFSEMNNFVNEPLASYQGKLYHLPFNMNTFYALWGVTTPEEARKKIEEQRKDAGITEVHNLRDQALSMVGKDIFEKLIEGYTEKQWGRKCEDLPASIIKRLPLRFSYNNNYFNDRYQGIPMDGYTAVIERMLKGTEVRLGVDYLSDPAQYNQMARHVIYTGEIDRYYHYCFGQLQYRTLKFETERLDMENYQGNAVVNYTEKQVPYTRISEHKWFNYRESPVTYITKEYPKEFAPGDDPFYPVNDERNAALYQKYQAQASAEKQVVFAGRLGLYKYFDMDDTIRAVLDTFNGLEK
ncbi:MAG: UDP-galactopyranose mutase [Bacilli bacterium]|jgi:UDP-galactopyranose mutase|nr:UDP-galactopyranose mutase [Bacilli bacterium]